MPESPLATPTLWNQIHRDYEKSLVPLFAPVAQRALQLCNPKPGDRVLDVACGPGTLAIQAARLVSTVVAVDFSQSMVDLLQQRCRQEGVTNIESRVADGMALPFAATDFDAAFSCFGLFMFPDRHQGLRELHRVLRPAGKLVVTSWAPVQGPMEAMYRIVREVLPGVPFQPGQAPLGTPQAIEQEVSAAGFAAPEVEAAAVRFRYPSVDAFWAENSRASGPLVAMKLRLPAPEWARVEARILELLRHEFAREVDFERRAWITLGRKPVAG